MIPDRLQTARLLMRPFANGDAAAVFRYWQSDPDWVRFNESVPAGFSPEDANSFVTEMCARDRRERPNWALVYEDTVVGVVSLSFENEDQIAVLGYGVHADLWGRGLCAEAATKVLDCAFAVYPALHTVRAHTHVDNSASARVLQKLGFSKEHTPGRDLGDGEPASHGPTFHLLRAEWSV
jgi:RimJ/RimL family protein N-acetyltransferase